MNAAMRGSMTCALLLILASVARGQIVVSPTATQAGNIYTYEYTLENVGSTAIIGFALELPTSVTDMLAPSGWDGISVPFGTGEDLLWTSTDLQYDLLPSMTLTGFSIKSSASPGEVLFSYLDDNFDGGGGRTVGPALSTVPEPGTFALLIGNAVAGIGFLLYRRKTRK